jgi:hypothetical protein
MSLVTAMHAAGSAGQDVPLVYQVLRMASQKEVQGGHKSGDLGVHLYDHFFPIQVIWELLIKLKILAQTLHNPMVPGKWDIL